MINSNTRVASKIRFHAINFSFYTAALTFSSRTFFYIFIFFTSYCFPPRKRMTRWDSLPNEILVQIIHAVGNEEKPIKTKSMKVNKQWYDWYQSIKYKEITIRLDLPDILLNNIIKSNFPPGEWVKSITFQELVAPPDFDDHTTLDVNEDLFWSFTCPKVKHVTLPEDNTKIRQSKDWVYFETKFKWIGNWSLLTLSVRPFALSVPCTRVHYFNCAYHLCKVSGSSL
jgi:hypothetical protein